MLQIWPFELPTQQGQQCKMREEDNQEDSQIHAANSHKQAFSKGNFCQLSLLTVCRLIDEMTEG
ncbi:hypothetical protein [Shewanella aquimarina]|uniref:hypothetical protein n=1 Tax=Shewanella aquimarina TaxID=260365 RepID=UPI0039EE1D82